MRNEESGNLAQFIAVNCSINVLLHLSLNSRPEINSKAWGLKDIIDSIFGVPKALGSLFRC